MPSNNAVLVGILTDVFPIETTPRITKRVFWVKQPDTERYPQHWELELIGDDVKRILDVKIGDRIEAHVEVKGRKYQKKDRSEAIFTSLRCVGIRILEKIDIVPSKRYTPPSHDKDVDTKAQGELPLN